MYIDWLLHEVIGSSCCSNNTELRKAYRILVGEPEIKDK
jgi:hypothetical protein